MMLVKQSDDEAINHPVKESFRTMLLKSLILLNNKIKVPSGSTVDLSLSAAKPSSFKGTIKYFFAFNRVENLSVYLEIKDHRIIVLFYC